jgi:hypothetical protein
MNLSILVSYCGTEKQREFSDPLARHKSQQSDPSFIRTVLKTLDQRSDVGHARDWV